MTNLFYTIRLKNHQGKYKSDPVRKYNPLHFKVISLGHAKNILSTF